MKRAVGALLVLDALLLLAALGIWVSLRGDNERENVANPGLRGSKPPAGQQLPDASGIPGTVPEPPTPAQLRGSAVALVATCIDCRSGDILGGFLARLGSDGLPDEARVVVYGWEGDMQRWAREWDIPEQFDLVEVGTPAGVAAARALFGIRPVGGQEESGITMLGDRRGRWRSTWFIGQLDAGDLRHDLEVLAGD